MDVFSTFLVLCIFILGSSRGTDQQANIGIFSVIDYGAIGDGVTDDSQAFLAAWSAACGAVLDSPILHVTEAQTFLLKPVKFEGPCKSPTINVQVYGNIVAPSDIMAWTGFDTHNWIVFSNVNGLIVDGSGQIDGKGSIWWDEYNKLHDSSKANFVRPSALAFHHCNNVELSGLTHIDSQKNHISIVGCTGFTISNLYINSPETSPNTDGIDIGQSSQIQIQDCIIRSGDDCIAIGGGSAYINITGVACGPGHGISIGSLGANGAMDTVEEVHVRDCNFTNTMFGARIKSWQGGSGYARHITFEDITLIDAANPILIDQYYCIPTPNCQNQTLAVQVSDVTYERIQGTSITDEAIKLSCSETVGCSNIVLTNINIAPAYPNRVVSSSCLNAHGTSSVTTPIIDCLLP